MLSFLSMRGLRTLYLGRFGLRRVRVDVLNNGEIFVIISAVHVLVSSLLLESAARAARLKHRAKLHKSRGLRCAGNRAFREDTGRFAFMWTWTLARLDCCVRVVTQSAIACGAFDMCPLRS